MYVAELLTKKGIDVCTTTIQRARATTQESSGLPNNIFGSKSRTDIVLRSKNPDPNLGHLPKYSDSIYLQFYFIK